MNAVIYRYNPTLAALVKNANPEFVHEFPAEMSTEEIKLGLKEVLKSAYSKAEELGFEFQFHVDGTVLSAFSAAELQNWRPKLIRQDDVNAYDKYAERVAEEAKRINRFGNPTVLIIRDAIADHNTEVYVPGMFGDADGVSLMDAEHAATHNWVNRLRKYDVRVSVIAARLLEPGLQDGYKNIRDVVVVCDHHKCTLADLIKECGGIVFNAYLEYSDSDLLTP